MLGACHKDKEDIVLESGYGYFPVEEGRWIEYRVDSVKIYGMQTDTAHWEMREVTGPVLSGENHIVYRYFRQAGSTAWTNQPVVCSVSVSSAEAKKVEDNVCFVKLVFPLEEGRRWDGNAYNSLESQEYTMVDIGKNLDVNNFTFPSTLKVMQIDLTTLISKDYAEEVFAKDIGMISARKIHIENLQSVQFKNGYTVEYTMMNRGKL